MEVFTVLGLVWAVLLSIELIELRISSRSKVEKMKEHLGSVVRVIQIETLGNLLLAYDAENQEFLAQGASISEVQANIMGRFPKKIFLLNKKPFSAMKLEGITDQ
jgi:hypothetical protein